jgi:transcriptional regulator with XRE-family HTH domain
MAKKTSPLLPSSAELLYQFGDRLRLARLRRRLTSKQVAERAGMSPMTLRSLERGGDGVTMGAYLAVMQVLGIEGDLNLLGQADTLGRELQDARMSPKAKPSAKLYAKLPLPVAAPQLNEPAPSYEGFTSSQTLAGLLTPAPTSDG